MMSSSFGQSVGSNLWKRQMTMEEEDDGIRRKRWDAEREWRWWTYSLDQLLCPEPTASDVPASLPDV